MKKLNVKEDMCNGCGACVAIDPEHFDFNDDGLSTVISQDNLDNATVLEATNACPVGAIEIEDKAKETTN